jgi:hypothetical protein
MGGFVFSFPEGSLGKQRPAALPTKKENEPSMAIPPLTCRSSGSKVREDPPQQMVAIAAARTKRLQQERHKFFLILLLLPG